MKQLTLDGREVEPCQPSRAMLSRLSPTQEGVLAHLREHGTIRPVDAGSILYANQGSGDWRDKYAGSDGSEVLRRMALRGLVHREGRGDWRAGGPEKLPRRRSGR